MENFEKLPQVLVMYFHGELNWSKKRLNLSSLARLLLEVR
jgi:hypothetical protein